MFASFYFALTPEYGACVERSRKQVPASAFLLAT